MINKENVMDIRSLKKLGYSDRKISEKTGLNRRTVKKYLQDGAQPEYKKDQRQSKLEPFKPLIEGWLEQDNYQASWIHAKLISEGFDGSYSTVQRYVEDIKERRDRKAYVRFETLAGQQAQVDFGDFQIRCEDGTTLTIYCFVMVLGYSRHMYLEFIDRCTMTRFLACHQHAFAFFGGIPAEIVYDNMKNVVIRRLVGRVQWNRTFEAFCLHYGFKPVAAPPYSPWVKGKVERPIQYVKEQFWRGYVYVDLDRANLDGRRWVNTTAANRIHGTTREQVGVRFLRERPALAAIPGHAFDISEKVCRKVFKDCQIAFDGNRYVVPHEAVGRKVLLRVLNGVLRVFDDDRMLTAYRIPDGKGQTLAHPQFYERLRADREQVQRKYRKPAGKAKATRGLLRHGLQVEVMARSLSVYEQEVS